MGRIEIIEHRGGWCETFNELKYKTLQNSLQAFCKSFQRGHGVELDIRDARGKLVISHSMANGNEISFEEFLDIYNMHKNVGTLALNIKSTEIQKEIKKSLEKYNVHNYFTFDMSIPDTLKYTNERLHYYIRHSEYEIDPQIFSPYLYKKATGVWLDQFHKPPDNISWITIEVMKQHLDLGKRIAIVSPELHTWGKLATDRLYKKTWMQYKQYFLDLSYSNYDLKNIAICTDFPIEAEKFFTKTL